MNRKYPFYTAGAVFAVFAALGLGAGCRTGDAHPGDTTTPPQTNPAVSPDEPVMPQASPSPVAKDDRTATVYRVKQGDEGAQLEPVKISLPAKEAGTPATFVMNEMANGKDSPLPKGTRIKSVKIEGDMATVDFNDAFQSNFTGGDRNEAVVFNAITGTLAQFPNVKRVQILVDGKKANVGGMQDTTEPIPVGGSETSGGG